MAPKPKEKPKLTTAAQPTSSQKKQAPPLPPIEDLFASINRHIQQSEFVQAAKVADQVLSIAPGDEDAFRCKVVALIKADDIDTAVSMIQSSQKLTDDLNYYKAYCLYRQSKLAEALEALKSLQQTPETMLLESQILYRVGKLDQCVDIYQKLQKSKIESIEINHVASLVLAKRFSEVQKMMEANRIKASSSFELAYNVACALIQTNKLNDAEPLLLTARRVGQETLMEDNFGEDDIATELAPLGVQLAYVQQLLGQPKDAMESYSNIISRNLADESSIAVAVNNIVALRGAKEIADSLKKLDKLKDDRSQSFKLSSGLEKLSPKQRETIYANRVLLLVHSNKMDQARESVSTMSEMFPDSASAVLLKAAILVKENKANKAEEALLEFSKQYPEKSKVALGARAQVAAGAGHWEVAFDSLSRIPEIQHYPGTVATLVALKERTGDADGACEVLNAAVQWQANSMDGEAFLNVILKEGGFFKLRQGREEEAAAMLERLVESENSAAALGGLVRVLAAVDVERAERYERQLKALAEVAAIDVSSLERTSGVNAAAAAAAEVVGKEAVPQRERKKKRKRKVRYPKGFDPENPGPPPDPERWLPRRERSSYRPRRKDKRVAQVRGSQGAILKDKEKPDGPAAAKVKKKSKK